MAGNGPTPKPANKRARRNRDPHPTTILRHETATPPSLPARGPAGLPWPAATRKWWATWLASPQAELFGSTDWSFLLDTAALHARYWIGDTGVAPELRLRVAKFGATIEDRARLRLTFAAADEADAKRGKKPARQASPSKARYGKLTVLPGGAAAASSS